VLSVPAPPPEECPHKELASVSLITVGGRMRVRRVFFQVVFLISFLLTMTLLANAANYAVIVVYGDSFSDNGNLFRVIGIPQPPYWNGRYSNGPVAMEDLAASLGVPLLDDAWGGATTGIGNFVDNGTTGTLGYDNLPGMTTTFNATKNSLPPALVRNSLFVVWGGINDFATNGLATTTADHAVSDVIAIVSGLQAMGAKQILVPGIPDLGFTPYYLGQSKAGLANFVSEYFNQKLRSALPKSVVYYDTASLYRKMTANPSFYGLTNVTQACYNAQGLVCSAPDQYLYWDSLHPTAHVHQILAGEFSTAVNGSFPVVPLGKANAD
jgi:cholinesterase